MSQFFDEGAAIEEAEFLAEATGHPHCLKLSYNIIYVVPKFQIVATDKVLETVNPPGGTNEG